MKVYSDITQLIGGTPLLELTKIKTVFKLKANIFAKLEYFNPAGSVKDRVALNMINDAEKKGLLKEGGVIVEPTSGNTGIGLALIAAARNYRLILTMPDTMSIERRNLIKAYGAEVVLTDGKDGMRGAINKARELAAELGAFSPSQFDNFANPQAHYLTTAAELWSDTDGNIDVLVACVGTGGTISGVGKYLKEKNPSVAVVAVEPSNSAVLSGKNAGAHKIQGIGAGFKPQVLDTGIYDEIITVDDADAFDTARMLAKTEGVLTGISSGAALKAAMVLAAKQNYLDKNIVVILPDTGERYLSSGLY